MSLSSIERIRLLNQLKNTIVMRNASNIPVMKLSLIREVQKLRTLLGMVNQLAKPVDTQATVKEKKDTSRFYTFTENRTRGQRQKDNNAAIALLRELTLRKCSPDQVTDADRSILAKYSGNGGNLTTVDGQKGSAYEYYTPKPIAQSIWSLMQEMGFKGGRVLDPCAGVGIFAATSPPDAVMDAVELDSVSGSINQLVNDGVGQSVTISPFEQYAATTPDDSHDAIIANVPFGTNADRGGNQFKDSLFQKDSLESYFMRRSLTKLKSGGLACFIVPPRVVSGKSASDQKLRTRLSVLAEFKGAYRLPNKVFGSAHADTIVDVVVFRKHSQQILNTIDELQGTNNDLLREANVLWPEFVDGKYFKGEGKRYVLGEFIKKDSSKARDVDRVVNDDSVQNIARLMRKFGVESRINLDLLEAAEIPEISYSEGDTLALNGQILTLRNGTWTADAAATLISADKAELMQLVTKICTPLEAVNAGVTWSQFKGAVEYLIETCQNQNIPAWAATVFQSLKDHIKAKDMFAAIATGLACKQVYTDSSNGDDLVTLYPTLAEAMRKYYSCKIDTTIDAESRAAVKFIGVHYQRKNGFSDYWQGKVKEIKVDLDARKKLEQTKYINGSLKIDIEKAKAIVTADGGQFDPMNDDNWLISADGKTVIAADDFFIGNLAKALNKLDEEIAKTSNPDIKNKLIHMKEVAVKRSIKVDVNRMNFDLRSPMILPQETLQFVQAFISDEASIKQNSNNKKHFVDIDITNKLYITLDDKLKNRIGDYLKNGTVTLGTLNVEPFTPEEALTKLDEMIRTYNTQFNTWVKSNPKIMARLESIANNPKNIYFKQVDDRSPMVIDGISSEWQFHGYQNAFARRIARSFSGINSFDVGLGKTATALISVQYSHNLGLKKKTLFVVPNNVLSNWYKESVRGDKKKGDEGYKAPIYNSSDDCLFIGLTVDKNGKPVVRSSDYDLHLNQILENRHKKIFMTFDAFQRIRLKDATIDDYETHLRNVDSSYQLVLKAAENEKKKSKLAKLTDIIRGNKASSAAPYLEDLGIDSLVIDECHAFKNSKEIVDFIGGKFLSTPMASSIGLDAQAKAWYIRRHNNGEGILGLTATPITNSPLEIYSMATLIEGEERVNSIMLGSKGSDAFMETICNFSEEQEMSVTGDMKSYRTFTGLRNLSPLRNMIKSVAVIENAESVGNEFFLPESDEQQTQISLPEDTSQRLYEYKVAYSVAKEKVQAYKTGRAALVQIEDDEIFTRVQQQTGESVELMAAPFNLINKMNNLIVDPDLDYQATFYYSDNQELAETICAEFNKKNIKEKRNRLGHFTNSANILKETILRNEDKKIIGKEYLVHITAKYDGERIILDSDEFNTQIAFEAVMDKYKLNVDMSIPPKMAALIDNIKTEMANPRGIDGLRRSQKAVKQIIFCDILACHTKIKHLLAKHCGIPKEKITFISGKYNSQPDEILEVQEGFNAGDEDNKYQIIIANKKAEVGINLQQGCQAIHHLTIGWTPDSLHQRNGRGVRQGNLTEKVNIYFYDADGTFDTYRRRLVNKKSDWINTLLNDETSDQVTVTGSLTREQQDALIGLVGDETAMATFQDRIEEAARTKRIAETRYSQSVILQTYQKTAKFLDDYQKLDNFAYIYLEKLKKLREELNNKVFAKKKAIDKNAAASTIEKHDKRINELVENISLLSKQVLETYIYEDEDEETFSNNLIDTNRSHYFNMWGFKLRNVKDSWIRREWQTQMETNQRMNQTAQDELKKSESKEGSYTHDTIESAKKGLSFEYKGTMIGVGGLIKHCNSDGEVSYHLVVEDSMKSISLIYFNKFNPRRDAITNVNYFWSHYDMNIDIVALIEKNGEGYQEALEYLAEYDKNCLARTHNEYIKSYFYAVNYIPELSYLTTETQVTQELDPLKYMFNISGIFPYIFDPESIQLFASTDTIEQWKSIAQIQSKFGKRQGSKLLTDIAEAFSIIDIEDFAKELCNNLRKYKLKLKQYAYELNTFYDGLFNASKLFFEVEQQRGDRIVQRINQAETLNDAKTARDSWLQELMGDVFEILPEFDQFLNMSDSIRELEYLPIKNAYEQACERFNIRSPEDFIYMTGDTLKAKKWLDDQGDSFRMIAEKANSEIGWRNKNGKGRGKDSLVIEKVALAPNNSWVFQRKMWQYLQQNYPSLIAEFNLDIKEGN